MTVREVIEEVLAGGDLFSEAAIIEGGRKYIGNRSDKNVGRMLRMMRREGVVERQSIDGKNYYKLLPAKARPKLSVSAQVKYEQKILQLEEQLRESKIKYKEALKQDILIDSMVDAIKDHTIRFEPVAILPAPVRSDGVETETAVLHIGDAHFKERVVYEETAGLAAYDMNIAFRRYQRLAETVIDITTQKLRGYSLPWLAAFMLGDFVSTNIHGILENTSATPVDSLFEGAFLMTQFFLDIAPHFEQVDIYTVPGNHGRLTAEVRYKQPWANWDYVFYQLLSVMLQKQDNIHFHIPRSAWSVVDLLGWKWLLMHGDAARQWMGIPFYGIIRALTNIRALLDTARSAKEKANFLEVEKELVEKFEKERSKIWKQEGIRFDYAAIAHFHTSGTLDIGTGEIFMNGGGIGPTDFSIRRMQAGTPPRHWFHGMSKTHGASWRYNLDLDRVPAGMKIRYKQGGESVLADEVSALMENGIVSG